MHNRKHKSPFVVFIILIILLFIGCFGLFVLTGVTTCSSGNIQSGVKVTDEDRADVSNYLENKYHKVFSQTQSHDYKTRDNVDNDSGHSVFEHSLINLIDENNIAFTARKEYNNSWQSNYQDEVSYSDNYESHLYEYELWTLLKNNGYFANEYELEPTYYSGTSVKFVIDTNYDETTLYGSLTNFINNINNDTKIRIYVYDVDASRDKEILGKILSAYPDLKPVKVECTFKDNVNEDFVIGNGKIVRS